MKLIDQDFKIIEQSDGIEGLYKQIELAGRTCYKSEDKITETSAEEFVNRMVKSKHGAMLEHGTVYLYSDRNFNIYSDFLDKYAHNKYSIIHGGFGDYDLYVTTNYRVLVENNWLKDLSYLCIPTTWHSKRVTIKFTLPISISREFIRHRVFSFAEQSTRYCNFSKDKFNNEIKFIKPYWYDEPLVNFNYEYGSIYDDSTPEKVFKNSCILAEANYFKLINNGYKPQEAREILPLCTATELVMTGFIEDWEHFLSLRCDNAAHPQARSLAFKVKEALGI